MKILIVLGHPKKGSFNHAIADKAAAILKDNGHTVLFHDLYEEKFDPGLPAEELICGGKIDPAVEKHCREVTEANGIIIIHPNWWGQPPAVLKGWLDRVIRMGVGYKFSDAGEGEPVGLLKSKVVMVFNTSNTPAEREQKVFGDPLENLWKTCVFGFCGVTRFYRRMFEVVIVSTPEQRRQWLDDVGKSVAKYFPRA